MKVDVVYFDLDGVLANFDYGMLHNFGIGRESMLSPAERWAHINKYEEQPPKRWFYDLSPMPGAHVMVNALEKELTGAGHSTRRVVLTATGNQFWTHRHQKQDWVEKHFPGYFDDVICVPKAECKQFYASPNSVLIDDNWERCVRPFIERGGKAIHHLNTSLTVYKMRSILTGSFQA